MENIIFSIFVILIIVFAIIPKLFKKAPEKEKSRVDFWHRRLYGAKRRRAADQASAAH
mgnify:CR=1 FL=1